MLKEVTKKGKKILTGALPKGRLDWVVISGEGRDNYNEDGKIYQASISWPTEEADKVEAQIKEYYESMGSDKDQQGGFGMNTGVLVEVEGEEEDVEKFVSPDKVTSKHKLSGNKQMQFSTNTTFGEGDKAKPNIIDVYNKDALKVKLPEGTMIGNGSIGSLQVTIRWGDTAKKQFISRYLNAVLIFKLEEYSAGADFEQDESISEEEGFTGFEDPDTGFTGEAEDKVDL